MQETSTILKKYFDYTKERFPLVPALLVTAALYYCAYFFGGLFKHQMPPSFLDSILGCLVLFLATFHVRIFDEHKDYEKDLKAHPERMLSKGIITLADLRKLLVILIVLEAVLSLYLGTTQFILWLVILAYTILMLKEFFIPTFLNRHMGLYLVSHQLLVPLMLLFPLLQRSPVLSDDECGCRNYFSILIFLATGVCACMTYEIARKTWSKEREHEFADSYTKIWGNTRAVLINQLLALAASAGFIVLMLYFRGSMVTVLVQAALMLVFGLAGLWFLKQPTTKNSKILEALGGLFLMGSFINAAISFYNVSQR